MNSTTTRPQGQPQIVYLTGADAVPPLTRERVDYIAPSVADWVLRPAVTLWAMGGAAGGAVAFLLGNPAGMVLAWALLAGGIIGAPVGVALAIWRPTERSRTTTEYQRVTVQAGGRFIPLSEAGRQRQLRIQQASEIVGGVTFRPAQLDAMRDTAAANGRLTRKAGGWSGPEYQRVTAALAGVGYLQSAGLRAWAWTDAGLLWLSPTPTEGQQGGSLTGDQDDDDQDGG